MVAAVVIVGCAKPASAAKKEYAHLVKPLSVQQPPAGLYTEPRIWMEGKDRERHIFNKPTVAICPKLLPHLPLITSWVDRPYGFFVVCLSGEHAAPWVEEQ